MLAYTPGLWNQVASTLSSIPMLVGAVLYGDSINESELQSASLPTLHHFAGPRPSAAEKPKTVTESYYPRLESHLFATPFQEKFNYWSESVSHTRNLSFLKQLMGGPYFDIETIWDENAYYEFADRSVEHTMSTMVDQPYVNHVPTVSFSTIFFKHGYANQIL